MEKFLHLGAGYMAVYSSIFSAFSCRNFHNEKSGNTLVSQPCFIFHFFTICFFSPFVEMKRYLFICGFFALFACVSGFVDFQDFLSGELLLRK